MSISGTIKAKQLNGVVPWGTGYKSYVEIDVEDLDISDTVTAEDVVAEYKASDLLDAIGEADVSEWLEALGYKLSKD